MAMLCVGKRILRGREFGRIISRSRKKRSEDMETAVKMRRLPPHIQQHGAFLAEGAAKLI